MERVCSHQLASSRGRPCIVGVQRSRIRLGTSSVAYVQVSPAGLGRYQRQRLQVVASAAAAAAFDPPGGVSAGFSQPQQKQPQQHPRQPQAVADVAVAESASVPAAAAPSHDGSPTASMDGGPSSGLSAVPAAATATDLFSAAARLRLPNLSPIITWTFMLSYMAFMLIMPITALLQKASLVPLNVFIARATEPVAMHAYYVTFSCSLIAAAINCVFGFVLAWVLVRYNFAGKKILDAAVDLPFALPTSVAGLTLATVYGDEFFIGQFLQAQGVQVVFTRLGVVIAMIFVSFPFVVRTMQPVMQEIQKEMEEAAWSLGASQWRTFTDVVLPPLLPALLTGTALAFSRALGEFGSIVIVSSNFAFKDLIAPVLIFQCLEQYDYVGATVIGTVLLLISLVMMLAVNQLQKLARK